MPLTSYQQVKLNFVKTIFLFTGNMSNSSGCCSETHKSVKESGQTEVSVAILILSFTCKCVKESPLGRILFAQLLVNVCRLDLDSTLSDGSCFWQHVIDSRALLSSTRFSNAPASFLQPELHLVSQKHSDEPVTFKQLDFYLEKTVLLGKWNENITLKGNHLRDNMLHFVWFIRYMRYVCSISAHFPLPALCIKHKWV